MNATLRHLKPIIVVIFIISAITTANGQAKNAIGFGPAINTSQKGGGFGGLVQGEIKVARSFSIVPSIGVEIPYIAYFSLAAKYYILPGLFTTLGPLAHIGGDDGIYAGLGGSAAAGVELLSKRRHVIDLILHGDVIKMDDRGNAGSVVGLRLIYNFSFSKRY